MIRIGLYASERRAVNAAYTLEGAYVLYENLIESRILRCYREFAEHCVAVAARRDEVVRCEQIFALELERLAADKHILGVNAVISLRRGIEFELDAAYLREAAERFGVRAYAVLKHIVYRAARNIFRHDIIAERENRNKVALGDVADFYRGAYASAVRHRAIGARNINERVCRKVAKVRFLCAHILTLAVKIYIRISHDLAQKRLKLRAKAAYKLVNRIVSALICVGFRHKPGLYRARCIVYGHNAYVLDIFARAGNDRSVHRHALRQNSMAVAVNKHVYAIDRAAYVGGGNLRALVKTYVADAYNVIAALRVELGHLKRRRLYRIEKVKPGNVVGMRLVNRLGRGKAEYAEFDSAAHDYGIRTEQRFARLFISHVRREHREIHLARKLRELVRAVVEVMVARGHRIVADKVEYVDDGFALEHSRYRHSVERIAGIEYEHVCTGRLILLLERGNSCKSVILINARM